MFPKLKSFTILGIYLRSAGNIVKKWSKLKTKYTKMSRKISAKFVRHLLELVRFSKYNFVKIKDFCETFFIATLSGELCQKTVKT